MVEGKEIDLYLLYWLVTAQGGWERVSLKNLPTYLQTKYIFFMREQVVQIEVRSKMG